MVVNCTVGIRIPDKFTFYMNMSSMFVEVRLNKSLNLDGKNATSYGMVLFLNGPAWCMCYLCIFSLDLQ